MSRRSGSSSMGGGLDAMMQPLLDQMKQKIREEIVDELHQKYQKKHQQALAKYQQQVSLLCKKSIQKMEQTSGGNEALKKQLPLLDRSVKETMKFIQDQEAQRVERNRALHQQVQEALNKYKRKHQVIQNMLHERQGKRTRLMETLSDDIESIGSLRSAIDDDLEEAATMMGGMEEKELPISFEEKEGEISPLLPPDSIGTNIDDDLMMAEMDEGEEYEGRQPSVANIRGGGQRGRGRGGRGRGRRAR